MFYILASLKPDDLETRHRAGWS
ncbi:uncharacterized protein FFB20_05106 [Fusarium fujikuroi]|nr:uncharacterized protein FFE2_01358 [Fusarium fujikuroi]SCN71841.1 uncharacterized protein FFC1_01352 [Fusarium fujikuroi]SCN75358.1 uncharacterized protein FFM5_01308 [Fusarium fujikuroi]SCN75980.1 uncharacterized protein FFB20_05106 [Fusarium fujikuroi]SCO28167.1 uncharacterized protein FFMR_00877 [Fusarium fujikuroi]